MTVLVGDANGFGVSEFGTPNVWKTGMPPSIYPNVVNPNYIDNIFDMRPYRYNVTTLQEVFNTDLPTTSFDGEIDLFPLYLGVQFEYSNIEYKCGIVGRVHDGYICPRGLADGTTVEEDSIIQYFKLGPWMFPATVAPVVGP
jgi:hypothetical protein